MDQSGSGVLPLPSRPMCLGTDGMLYVIPSPLSGALAAGQLQFQA